MIYLNILQCSIFLSDHWIVLIVSNWVLESKKEKNVNHEFLRVMCLHSTISSFFKGKKLLENLMPIIIILKTRILPLLAKFDFYIYSLMCKRWKCWPRSKAIRDKHFKIIPFLRGLNDNTLWRNIFINFITKCKQRSEAEQKHQCIFWNLLAISRESDIQFNRLWIVFSPMWIAGGWLCIDPLFIEKVKIHLIVFKNTFGYIFK